MEKARNKKYRFIKILLIVLITPIFIVLITLSWLMLGVKNQKEIGHNSAVIIQYILRWQE